MSMPPESEPEEKPVAPDTIPCLPPDDCSEVEHGYIDAEDEGPFIVLYGGDR